MSCQGLNTNCSKQSLLHEASFDLEDFVIEKPQASKPSRCEMIRHFVSLAGPSVITNVFSYLVMTVNTIFAG